MSGNICKFCGAREHSKINGVYLCGSGVFASEWKQSDNCQQLCEQIRVQLEGTVDVLHTRIAAAINAAQQAIKLNLGLQDEDGEEVDWEHDGVAYVLESDLNRVVDILTGSYPEIPDDLGKRESEQ